MPVTWTSAGNCSTARPGSGRADRPDASPAASTYLAQLGQYQQRRLGVRTSLNRSRGRNSGTPGPGLSAPCDYAKSTLLLIVLSEVESAAASAYQKRGPF